MLKESNEKVHNMKKQMGNTGRKMETLRNRGNIKENSLK